MKENNIVHLSLGTNMGERAKNLQIALDEINKITQINKKSKTYQTSPVGFRDQEDFFNMAIEIQTELNPIELIVKLQEIEHKMGRQREIPNGPRIIDLDIIFFNNQIINNPDLKIPHPRMHKRNFVLEPLNEISPTKKHPLLNQTVEQLYQELNG